MEKDGKEKGKSIMQMVNYVLKENIKMEKKMENGQNMIVMVKLNLMENIQREKDGMVKVWNKILMDFWSLMEII